MMLTDKKQLGSKRIQALLYISVLENVYCNEGHPENISVCVDQDNIMYFHENGKWKRNTKDPLHELLYQGNRILAGYRRDHYEAVRDVLNCEIKLIDDICGERTKTIDPIKEEIASLIKNTRECS